MARDSHMRPQAIRFTPETWDLVKSVADAEGVSASQFVREAALVRAVYIGLLRGAPGMKLYRMVADVATTLGKDFDAVMAAAEEAIAAASHHNGHEDTSS